MSESGASIDSPERGMTGHLIPALVGAGLAVALVTPKGFGVFLGLALLVALSSLRYRQLPSLRPQDWLFLLLVNAYPLLVAVSMAIHGVTDPDVFDNASRFLILSIVYLALRSRPYSLSIIVIGAIAGCILTFGAAAFHLLTGSVSLHGPQGRFVAFENAIVFAQIAFFLLLIAATPVRLPSLSDTWIRSLIFAVMLMASASLVVSESRGVLLALLLLYFYLLFFDRRLTKSGATRFALLLAGFGAGIYLLNTPHLDHLGGTTSELAANYQEIDQRTSLGQRLSQWSMSWSLITQEPLLGYGAGQFKEALNSLPGAASLTERVRDYGHSHNDFLTLAVEQGVISLLIFVGALLSLLLLARRESFAMEAKYLLYGTVFFWMFFGLTQTQLAHQKTTMMLALLLMLGFSHGMNRKFGALDESVVHASGIEK